MSAQWDPGHAGASDHLQGLRVRGQHRGSGFLVKRAAEKLSPGQDYKVSEGLSSGPVAEAGATRGPHTQPANPGHTRNSGRGSLLPQSLPSALY